MNPNKYLFMTLIGLLFLGWVGLVVPVDGVPGLFIFLALQQLLLAGGGYLGSLSLGSQDLSFQGHHLIWGALAGVGLFAVTTLSMGVLVLVLSVFWGMEGVLQRLVEERHAIDTMIQHAQNTSVLPLLFFTVVGAAVSEELFFRGFLVRLLERKVSHRVAIVVSALVFALLHRHVFQFAPIFFAGIYLAWLFIKSSNIWRPIMAHGVSNGLVLWIALAYA